MEEALTLVASFDWAEAGPWRATFASSTSVAVASASFAVVTSSVMASSVAAFVEASDMASTTSPVKA